MISTQSGKNTTTVLPGETHWPLVDSMALYVASVAKTRHPVRKRSRNASVSTSIDHERVTMDTMHWLELWTLNEIVVLPGSVSRLIFHPTDEWQSNWEFPGRAVFEATRADRKQAILNCVASRRLSYFELGLNISSSD